MEQENPSASLEGSSGHSRLSPGLVFGLLPVHLAHPKRGATASPPLVVPAFPPFTQLLIALHKEVLVTPFTTFTFSLGK